MVYALLHRDRGRKSICGGWSILLLHGYLQVLSLSLLMKIGNLVSSLNRIILVLFLCCNSPLCETFLWIELLLGRFRIRDKFRISLNQATTLRLTVQFFGYVPV